ncbi:MAG: HipA domain-containing protein [Pseudomonadota bacterium]
MNDVQVLQINLYEDPIGTLTLVQGDRSIFAFNESYLADEDRATLSLSFKDEFGDIITQMRPTQTRLSPFFSNLLPEGHMREYLAKRAGVKNMREFHLLWALGADLPGAMVVTSMNDARWDVDEVGVGHEDPGAVRAEKIMRFSLAGVQIKFSAIAEASGGLTIPVDGLGGSWIVKLPSSRFQGVPINEHAMMRLAACVGIEVPEHRLVDPGDIIGLPSEIEGLHETAFAIKRFDRTSEGGRIHVEDFAQVFGVYPREKYEKATYRSLAKVLWIETGAAGVAEFIRRLVFNTLIGNADMHLKNWSLIYLDRRKPSLSPAYDFVSTIAFLEDEYAALKYAQQRRMKAFGFDELRLLAAKAGAPETLVVETAKETIHRFHDVWLSEKDSLGLTDHMRRVIDVHYQGTALWAEVLRPSRTSSSRRANSANDLLHPRQDPQGTEAR